MKTWTNYKIKESMSGVLPCKDTRKYKKNKYRYFVVYFVRALEVARGDNTLICKTITHPKNN